MEQIHRVPQALAQPRLLPLCVCCVASSTCAHPPVLIHSCLTSPIPNCFGDQAHHPLSCSASPILSRFCDQVHHPLLQSSPSSCSYSPAVLTMRKTLGRPQFYSLLFGRNCPRAPGSSVLHGCNGLWLAVRLEHMTQLNQHPLDFFSASGPLHAFHAKSDPLHTCPLSWGRLAPSCPRTPSQNHAPSWPRPPGQDPFPGYASCRAGLLPRLSPLDRIFDLDTTWPGHVQNACTSILTLNCCLPILAHSPASHNTTPHRAHHTTPRPQPQIAGPVQLMSLKLRIALVGKRGHTCSSRASLGAIAHQSVPTLCSAPALLHPNIMHDPARPPSPDRRLYAPPATFPRSPFIRSPHRPVDLPPDFEALP